jgi:hypothetical protein
MGFGLHSGWAIEGAIGSEFKIDASYLSPNVNMAARLEAATKQFGVSILISHWHIELCDPKVKSFCRLIDHITVKGSKQPMKLYTIDLDVNALEVDHRPMERMVRNRYKVRQLREVQKSEKWSNEFVISDVFRKDPDIRKMRDRFEPEFNQRFDMAFRNYEAGEWAVARDMLDTTRFFLRNVMKGGREEDGPTAALLNFMKEYEYVSPDNWPGYRELTEK